MFSETLFLAELHSLAVTEDAQHLINRQNHTAKEEGNRLKTLKVGPWIFDDFFFCTSYSGTFNAINRQKIQ